MPPTRPTVEAIACVCRSACPSSPSIDKCQRSVEQQTLVRLAQRKAHLPAIAGRFRTALLYTIVMKPSDAPTSIDVSMLLQRWCQQRSSEEVWVRNPPSCWPRPIAKTHLSGYVDPCSAWSSAMVTAGKAAEWALDRENEAGGADVFG